MQTTDTLHRNLAALPPISVPLRDLLLAQLVPAAWAPAIGTDSTLTFQRVHLDRVEWLGNTSMPAASAAPLTSAMVPGQTNGLGLAIGTGYEWRHLLGKLQTHQALFVMEPDLTAARLALSICDLSGALASGKLILLLGPDIERQLTAWLEAFPGLEPPAVMHPLPTLPQEQRNALLTAGEAAVRAAIIARAQQVDAAAMALNSIEPVAGGSVAMLMLPAHRWKSPVPYLQLDHHLQGGRLARIRLILQHRPAVIVSDHFRQQLQIPLPDHTAVETHLAASASTAFWQAENLATIRAGLAPQDRIIVMASAHKDLLTRAGFAAGQVAVAAPWEAQNRRIRRTEQFAAAEVDLPGPVLLAADLPSIDPAAYDLTLPSHITLWQAAIELINQDPLAVHWDMAADLFRRAQQRASIDVTDAALAATLQLGIRHALLETLPRLHLARELHAAGIPLLLIGSGWQQAGLSSPKVVMGAFAGPESEEPASMTGAMYLHFSPTGVVAPAVLGAIEAGIPVAAFPHPLDTRPGGICTLLEDQAEFLRLARPTWLAQLRTLLNEAPRRRRLAGAAKKRLESSH